MIDKNRRKSQKRPSGWDSNAASRAGDVCIEILFDKTDLLTKGWRAGGGFSMPTIEPGDELLKNAAEYNEKFTARKRPMICLPRPWTRSWGGGYLTTYDPLIQCDDLKIKGVKRPLLERTAGLDNVSAPRLFAAVNALQAVPWCINRTMLDSIRMLWNEAQDNCKDDYSNYAMFLDLKKMRRLTLKKQETRRKQLIAEMAFILSEAEDLARYERFYLPVYLDFRGRVYYQCSFNPQRSDVVRALMDFADKKPLDDDRYFRAYGARLFTGETDYHKRLKWYDNDFAMDFDPQATWWREAKEPLQFLRFCLDWVDFAKESVYKQDHITGMPVYLDASSSVIQHIALLLRSAPLAEAVNLTGFMPQDAYAAIAADMNAKIVSLDSELADIWKTRIFERGDVKTTIMTIPYGRKDNENVQDFVKAFSDTLILFEGYDYEAIPAEISKKQQKAMSRAITRNRTAAGRWLLDVLVDCVEKRLPGVYALRRWMERIADLHDLKDQHIEWQTPTEGFFVRQRYYEYDSIRIKITKTKKSTLRKPQEPKNKDKAKSALLANFIHSLDAATLIETIAILSEHTSQMGVVHDCFCVHFNNAEHIELAARDAIVRTHRNDISAVHKHFEKSLGEQLPEIRDFPGDFDINLVKKATYMIS